MTLTTRECGNINHHLQQGTFALIQTPVGAAASPCAYCARRARKSGICQATGLDQAGGGLNLYGYAGADPVNFSDPFGLCCFPLLPGVARALGSIRSAPTITITATMTIGPVAFQVGEAGVDVKGSASFALAATLDATYGPPSDALGSMGVSDLYQLTPVIVGGGEIQRDNKSGFSATVSLGLGWVPPTERLLPALSLTATKAAEAVGKLSVKLTTPSPEKP